MPTVSAKIAAPGTGTVAVGPDAVWVTNGDGSVSRVDPAANKVTATYSLTSWWALGCCAFTEGAVWLTDMNADTVIRVDPATGKVVATIPVRDQPMGIAAGFGSVWVAHEHDDSVGRIDPATNKLVAVIPAGGASTNNGPLVVQVTADSVWVSVPSNATIIRIDPDTNTVTAKVSVGQECTIAPLDEVLWIGGGCGGSTISQIDTTTNVRSGTVDETPQVVGGLVPDNPNLWYIDFDGVLHRFDTKTRADTGTLTFNGYNVEGEAVAVGDGSVWVRAKDTLLRLTAG